GTSLALAGVAAQAAPLDTAGASQCEFTGYAKDRDPKGTNVRIAPRADAAVIGRLAPLTKISADEWTGVEFDIVGSKDGWLRSKKPHRRGGMKLRARPRASPAGARFYGGNWSPMSVGVSAIHGCEGKYVEVTAVPPNGKPLRGWSYAPCPLQLTACDGWRLAD